MYYDEMDESTEYYTATGSWRVIGRVANGRWMAEKIWNRDGTPVPLPPEHTEFDLDDLGGCDLMDNFQDESTSS